MQIMFKSIKDYYIEKNTGKNRMQQCMIDRICRITGNFTELPDGGFRQTWFVDVLSIGGAEKFCCYCFLN